ncbi:MAG: glycosyltransferase family 2 protein [Simkaniaceae bacterium]|nr:glycosyltransferase family 2 protein [Simkaniaceae bacterium]
MLTKNSEKTIHQALRSVESLAEVILIDTGSSDRTLEMAKEFDNVKIYSHAFTGFGDLKNLAMTYASNDWILSLDSDEVLTPEALKEICETNLDSSTVYSFPFHNYYNGKWIKGCGWYPDRHIRLYNKKVTSFSASFVHEGIEVDHVGVVKFKNAIDHFSYLNIDDFLRKMESYSTLFAEQNQFKKESSILKAFLHGFFAFFKSYFIKRGFFDGREGFIISMYNGQTTFYKYLKLWEFNQKC